MNYSIGSRHDPLIGLPQSRHWNNKNLGATNQTLVIEIFGQQQFHKTIDATNAVGLKLAFRKTLDTLQLGYESNSD